MSSNGKPERDKRAHAHQVDDLDDLARQTGLPRDALEHLVNHLLTETDPVARQAAVAGTRAIVAALRTEYEVIRQRAEGYDQRYIVERAAPAPLEACATAFALHTIAGQIAALLARKGIDADLMAEHEARRLEHKAQLARWTRLMSRSPEIERQVQGAAIEIVEDFLGEA